MAILFYTVKYNVNTHFLISSVEYLGHQINQEGIRAIPSKVEAITNSLPPTSVQELWSFLGLLNYYGKFN